MQCTNWGRYPRTETSLGTPGDITEALEQVEAAPSLVGRGMGRCYGDSALNASRILSSLGMNRFISFDQESGLLVAEAGVSLAEIMDCFLPRGWFVPVTPGTKYVTLGGAIASDVHGKNHHVAGSFGMHVDWLDIITADKGLVRCSPAEQSELFHATCGGHGLTGLIVRAALRLVRVSSAWIRQKCLKTGSLRETMDAFEEYASWQFSVAWIDCLKKGPAMGRSLLLCGEFASPEELDAPASQSPHKLPRPRSFSVPLDFPSWALNPLSVSAFNALYYGRAPKGISDALLSCNSFFYPLDAVHDWNRIYGKRGFAQYQFVIPQETAATGLPRLLSRIARSGLGSFLAVLKLFGAQPRFRGNISFPMKGYTLALDFPISRNLFSLFSELDRMVLDYGGRHYLTKDARLPAAVFAESYGVKALEDFMHVRQAWDRQGRFSSLQSRRLMGY